MSCDILEAFAKRHSCYNINNKITITNQEIENLINKCLDLYPSSFNSQDARVILLMGEHHTYFWELVKKELFRVSQNDRHTQIEEKITKFEKGYGTILFFIEPDSVLSLQNAYPEYSANFPIWARESNAMLQFMIWSSLADKGIGASLQHYNPLIDNIVKQQFQINPNWQFIAQMPFGHVTTEVNPHKIKDISDRLTIRP